MAFLKGHDPQLQLYLGSWLATSVCSISSRRALGLCAMKFAHEYEAALQQADYPQHWVESAISYRQLKKCIKNVQRELSTMGLDPNTIAALWTSIDPSHLAGGPLQYSFADSTNFEPKLIFIVDTEDGSPVDACLAPDTRAYLQALAVRLNLAEVSTIAPSNQVRPHHPRAMQVGSHVSAVHSSVKEPVRNQKLEIPLRVDGKFFRLLNDELLALKDLRSKEEHMLARDVVVLGEEIGRLTLPSPSVIKADVYAWREVFSLYIDCNVFFSTAEQDSSDRSSLLAQGKFQDFSLKLQELGFPQRLKKGQSRAALELFIRINSTLLQNLKFQELNVTAMTKILKKFEKRTALRAKDTFVGLFTKEAFSSSTMAKAVCFEISEKVLSVVPQLSDYLCPVCFNISYKPIRLRCGHVFCIRCMIIMQRAKNDHCPLCRGTVVMQADSGNLDPALMSFLKRYFPTEVKAKQKENERNAAIDKYGKELERCQIM
ncbi:MAG: hypothetical protein Q9187_000230 [Circinaria calcarea]